MMIGLTARMKEHVLAGRPLYLAAEIDHPDGLVYIWAGTGDLTYDGHLWKGRGALGEILPVESKTELSINDVRLVLAGVSAQAAELLEDMDVRNRVATAWLFGLDRSHHVIADPFLLGEMRMDTMNIESTDQGAVGLVISAHMGLWTLERAQNLAWTAEQQKEDFPATTDTGFDLIPGLESKEILWRLT